MIDVLRAAIAWVGRHLLRFALIVACLLALAAILGEVREAGRIDREAAHLHAQLQVLQDRLGSAQSELSAAVAAAAIRLAPLERATAAVDTEIERVDAALAQLRGQHCGRRCERVEFWPVSKC